MHACADSPVADGAMHCVVCGDEKPRVDKLKQDERGQDVQPVGAVTRPKINLPAAMVEQRSPDGNQADCNTDALHIIAGGPVGTARHMSWQQHSLRGMGMVASGCNNPSI